MANVYGRYGVPMFAFRAQPYGADDMEPRPTEAARSRMIRGAELEGASDKVQAMEAGRVVVYVA